MKMSDDQIQAIDNMGAWYKSNTKTPFLLTGAAGTGKTTILKEFIKQNNINILKILVCSTAALVKSKSASKIAINGVIPESRTIAQLCKTPISRLKIKKTKYTKPNKNGLKINELLDYFKSIKQNIGDDKYDALKREYIIFNSTQKSANIASVPVAKFNAILGTNAFIIETDYVNRFDTIDNLAKNLLDFNLVIIDEVSMITTEDLDKIAKMCAYADIKLMLVGDNAQLPPIVPRNHIDANGNQYILHQKDVVSANLTTIHRQSDTSNLMNIISDLRDGKTTIAQYAIQHSDEQNQDFAIIKFDGDLQKLYETFDAADQIITLKNEKVTNINRFMRQMKFKDDAKNPINVGEKIMVVMNEPNFNIDTLLESSTENLYEEPLSNGLSGHVTKVYSKLDALNALAPHQNLYLKLFDDNVLAMVDVKLDDNSIVEKLLVLTIALDEPNKRDLNQITSDYRYRKYRANLIRANKSLFGQKYNNLAGHQAIQIIKYGYAKTVHKVQGLEWNNIIYVTLYRDSNFQNFSRRLEYTAITRCKKSCKVLIQQR